MFDASATSKKEQFNAIYYGTHKKLHQTVLNLCKDKELTLDILQKVYLRLWEKWDHLADKTNLSPLLFTYSKNIYIDELRKDKCSKKAKDNIIRVAESYSPSVESQYKRKEYLEVVNSALSRLTNRRREVVELYLTEGLSRKKLAERLSISPNTIDNHLSESLCLLRQELKLYLNTGID